MALQGVISFAANGTSNFPKTSEDKVREKLRFLLQTYKGTIPDDLQYGTLLEDLVFVPIDIGLQLSAENEVRTAVATYLPEVTIESVIVTSRGEEGLLRFEVVYSLARGPEEPLQFEVTSSA